MNVNLNQLRSFYMAAKYGSITKAAEKLFVTPPAITMQIKKLEEWLGFRLLYREHNKIITSEAALHIYKQAEVIFREVEKLETSLERLLMSSKKELLIGSHHIPAKYILPKLIEHIKELQPEIEIKVILDTIPALLEKLQKQEVHLVLSATRTSCPKIKSVSLFKEELALVARPDSRHVRGVKMSVNDLEKLPFLLPEKNTRMFQVITSYFVDAYISPVVVMDNISADLIKNFILKDMGVAFLLRFSVKDKIKRGELLEIKISEGPPMIEFNLGFLSENTLFPHVQAIGSYFESKQLMRSHFL